MKKLNSALMAATFFAAAALPAFGQNTTSPGTVAYFPGAATESASYTSTLNNKSGVITINPWVVPANGFYTETITNSAVSATDVCFASAQVAAGKPTITNVVPAAGSLAITVNALAPIAMSGAGALSFVCYK